MARGPKPTVQPPFTPKQVAQAQQVAARPTEAHVKVLRTGMVLALAQQPDLSIPDLARKVGAHQQQMQVAQAMGGEAGRSLGPDRGPFAPRPTFPCGA